MHGMLQTWPFVRQASALCQRLDPIGAVGRMKLHSGQGGLQAALHLRCQSDLVAGDLGQVLVTVCEYVCSISGGH